LAPYFWLVNKQRFDAGHLGVRIIAESLADRQRKMHQMKFRLPLATVMLGLWASIASLTRFSVPLGLKPQLRHSLHWHGSTSSP
jgi:hypothetical protein